jgi:hypothetical protein
VGIWNNLAFLLVFLLLSGLAKALFLACGTGDELRTRFSKHFTGTGLDVFSVNVISSRWSPEAQTYVTRSKERLSVVS